MALTKIGSAEVTDFSQKQYKNTAAFQDPSKYPSSFQITPASSTTESDYQNTRFSEQHGAYLENPEVAGMIDRKAQFVVGKGYKIINSKKKDPLANIRGNGLDTANTIFYNGVRVYTMGGDFFAEIIRNKRGELRNLKPLNPGSVKIIADNKGMVQRYEVFFENKEGKQVPIKLKKSQMFHLAYNRLADQIHGQSVIDKLKAIINMRREGMQDLRVVFHRYVKPLWIFQVDTDDTTEIGEFKAKIDSTIEKAENLVVPKDTVDKITSISLPQFSTLDPLPWLKLLQIEFLKAEGVPAIVMGISGAGESESKILYLAWQQVVEFNQMFLEEQIKAQLGIEVEFEFPASIAPELIADEKKDPKLTSNKVDPRKDSK